MITLLRKGVGGCVPANNDAKGSNLWSVMIMRRTEKRYIPFERINRGSRFILRTCEAFLGDPYFRNLSFPTFERLPTLDVRSELRTSAAAAAPP
eukprot:scaffold34606_cov192-Amphora_coffeaeformis.AAC.15